MKISLLWSCLCIWHRDRAGTLKGHVQLWWMCVQTEATK